jgi:hypothetical protein
MTVEEKSHAKAQRFRLNEGGSRDLNQRNQARPTHTQSGANSSRFFRLRPIAASTA